MKSNSLHQKSLYKLDDSNYHYKSNPYFTRLMGNILRRCKAVYLQEAYVPMKSSLSNSYHVKAGSNNPDTLKDQPQR